MPNVSVAVHRGAMFMAHIAYVKNGMLQQETVFVRGLSQEGADQAIAAYVNGLQSEADLGKTLTAAVMLPGTCTLIMPDETERPPAELQQPPATLMRRELAMLKRGETLLLPCVIERTAFNENRLVTVRGNHWEFHYANLLDVNRQHLARHLPVRDADHIDGFIQVRWLRQDGEHSMVELPNGCALDCVAGELVRQ